MTYARTEKYSFKDRKKYLRAKRVIQNKGVVSVLKAGQVNADSSAYQKAKSEKKEGDDLLARVYEFIGGKFGEVKEETKSKVEEVKPKEDKQDDKGGKKEKSGKTKRGGKKER